MTGLRCTKAVIYNDNLAYNIQNMRKHLAPGTKLCVAVKADAYGHGAVNAARIAVDCGAQVLAVATTDEGIELRENGITAGILLLSLCTPQELPLLFRHNITPLVFSKEHISLVREAADRFFSGSQRFPVQLAVDTGMGRIGCYPEEAAAQARLIAGSAHLVLDGMATHFAVADSLDADNIAFTRAQFDAFTFAVQEVRAAGINPGTCSCGNSAVILNNPDMHFDMVRAGIITYGYYPDQITREYLEKNARGFDIKPVMAFETRVAAIRRFPKGKSVSYGRTWTAVRETDIAVLPVGYADGFLRRFSPGAQVTINGRLYPVTGRICMDQCMVEIGKDNPDVHTWDKVLLFGPKESGALTTADDLAQLGNTIPYEVLTSVAKRVPREDRTSR